MIDTPFGASKFGSQIHQISNETEASYQPNQQEMTVINMHPR